MQTKPLQHRVRFEESVQSKNPYSYEFYHTYSPENTLVQIDLADISDYNPAPWYLADKDIVQFVDDM